MFVYLGGELKTEQVTGQKDAKNHLEANQPFVEFMLYGVTSAATAQHLDCEVKSLYTVFTLQNCVFEMPALFGIVQSFYVAKWTCTPGF